MQPTQLGIALLCERKRRGWKQHEVGEHFGVSQPTYYRWESGENVPESFRYDEIAQFLGCSLERVWRMIHNPNGFDQLAKPEDARPAFLESVRACLSSFLEALRARLKLSDDVRAVRA